MEVCRRWRCLMLDRKALVKLLTDSFLTCDNISQRLIQDTADSIMEAVYHEDFEPVAKTKVWRWETIETSVLGNKFIQQTDNLFNEQHAANCYSGYTKVPGSEREI